MEPAKINWKDSTFAEDEIYEHINAPKWVDFSAPEQDSVDDVAWFCRPDCKHPTTPEDFLNLTPPSKAGKLCKSAEIPEKTLPFGERNGRDACMKRRGVAQSSNSSKVDPKLNEDGENQNPNLSTPVYHHLAKPMKGGIKSSNEKKQITESLLQNADLEGISTHSSRNLFAGRDILNHITEFCNELKRLALATKAGEREDVKKEVEEDSGELDGKGMEREPLLEIENEKHERTEKATVKPKLRRKIRIDEAENVPITLNLENIKSKGKKSMFPIQTNPPSPQCFSATPRSTKTLPSKASSRLKDGGILQEVQQNKEVTREELADKGRSVSTVKGREARAMDVFWFLKPCTLSS